MLLMDITTFDSNESINSKPKVSNNFFDYIYLETGEKLLKFKITIDNYMNLISVLENYILSTSVDKFKVVNEKQLKNMKTAPKHFLPYVGKYANDGEFRKTDHYYVPKTTPLLELFIDFYKNAQRGKEIIVTSADLNDFVDIIKNTKDYNDIRAIDQILSCVTIKLEDECKFNSESLKSMITGIRKITGQDNVKDLVQRLYHIQITSKSNIENIKFLNLEERFIETTKVKSQKVK